MAGVEKADRISRAACGKRPARIAGTVGRRPKGKRLIASDTMSRSLKPVGSGAATDKRIRQRDQATKELLALFAAKSALRDYLQAAVGALRRASGLRCVGIRVADKQGNVPYLASVGFGKRFLELENWLNLRTNQCTCLRVISGRIDPQDRPTLTAGGSFHCPDVQRFTTGLPASRRHRYRGICLQEGFRTLVVIPFRYRGRVLGAIHLADNRPARISADDVQYLESIAPLIGEAVRRFHVEQGLRRNRLALSESQANFRRIIETAVEGIWMTDAESRTMFVNDRMAGMLGYKAAELIGRSLFDFMDEPWRVVGRAHVRRQSQGIVEQHDFQFRHRDGGAVWAIVSSTPIFDAAGRYAGALKMVTDITERRRLEVQVLNTAEQERQRIGRDLHDSLGQTLTSLAFLAKAMEQKLAGYRPELAAEAGMIASAASAAISQAQALARGLCPVYVTPEGLADALRELAEQTEKVYGIRCVFSVVRPAPVHDSAAAEHVYRIAQEALHNAVQHAKASIIRINLRPADHGAQLTIRDDGVGLPVNPTGLGMGLRTMRYRAGLVGGSLDAQRHPDGGTVVTCWLPEASPALRDPECKRLPVDPPLSAETYQGIRPPALRGRPVRH